MLNQEAYNDNSHYYGHAFSRLDYNISLITCHLQNKFDKFLIHERKQSFPLKGEVPEVPSVSEEQVWMFSNLRYGMTK